MVCRAKYGTPNFTALLKYEKKMFSQLMNRLVNISWTKQSQINSFK